MQHKRQQIEIIQLEHGHFPKVFELKGKRIVVDRVVRCYTVSGKNPRHTFQVECGTETYQINHHTLSGEWSID